jgi:TPP-dependent pyruvate/acetoin dehydrogenase alpha subunit
VVLICQNNQWAISTPGRVQTASETIAIKGIGYGLESLRADGNDVFAVYEVCKYAADKARRGDGPTFIELLTYRVSAHSSSDDPTRYRDEAITEIWRHRRDPIARRRIYMESRGWLADGEHDAVAARAEAHAREVIARVEAAGPVPIESLIEDVYEEPSWLLREQLTDLTGD